MTDTIASTLYGKHLKIGHEFNRGGQGIIWETDDPRVLLKQFEPTFISDDTQRQQDLRQTAERAYQSFCAVNKGHQAELRSLPREYLTFRGNPAYLMQKADGALLQTLLRKKTITTENKVPLAHALARAIRKLHAAQIVHADPHPENFVVKQDRTDWIVSVLDIDGGGLLSPPGPVYPMSQPKRIYKAPELCAMHWKHLHEQSSFFTPDQWALAVLLYQILVDYEGPFCTVQKHPNPLVKNYIPFKTYAYRNPSIRWPLPWQEDLLSHAKLSDTVISLFYETFQHRFALEKRPRPTAAQWEAALCRTTALPPVWHVSTLPPASMPSKSAEPPSPVPGKAVVLSGPGWAQAGRGRFLPLRARVKKKLCAGLWAAQGAFGLCRAFGRTVRSLHPIRAMSYLGPF